MILHLYGTACCHLCEEAAAVLQEAGVEATAVDILQQDALMERYGVRIPVLANGHAELDWPFDAAAVRVFCAAD